MIPPFFLVLAGARSHRATDSDPRTWFPTRPYGRNLSRLASAGAGCLVTWGEAGGVE